MTCLANRSFTSLSGSEYPTIGYTSAFGFWHFEENKRFEQVIKAGLDAFEEVFGYRSMHFTPPGGQEHSIIYPHLFAAGCRFIDLPLLKREHQGEGKYKLKLNYTGKQMTSGLTAMVRNVVFEPSVERSFDWVAFTLRQVEAALRWQRPANISSHRVNFCGHISTENRKNNLDALQRLLDGIVNRWPDVEFMGTAELAKLIDAG